MFLTPNPTIIERQFIFKYLLSYKIEVFELTLNNNDSHNYPDLALYIQNKTPIVCGARVTARMDPNNKLLTIGAFINKAIELSYGKVPTVKIRL